MTPAPLPRYSPLTLTLTPTHAVLPLTVYGEVNFGCLLGLFSTIRSLASDPRPGPFVDLGCGSGGVLCAALMCSTGGSHAYSSVLGIDLLEHRLAECRALLAAAAQQGIAAHRPALAVYGNIATEPWAQPGEGGAPPTVYCCATCFSDDL